MVPPRSRFGLVYRGFVQAHLVLDPHGLSGCRLFLDPLVDLDRTGDINHGLLDRLSNPRPAFHVVRCMNTLLFASGEQFWTMAGKNSETENVLGVRSQTRRLWLFLPDGGKTISSTAFDGFAGTGGEILCFDLAGGTSEAIRENHEALRQRFASLRSPILVIQDAQR